jgi:hypothetical protein
MNISGVRLGTQNRMPAPHPPKAPPFVALPAQPKIPQPASNAVIPSTATASLRRRQLRTVPASLLARSNISYQTSPTFASIKHLTFVHEISESFISIFETPIGQFGILTFYVFATKTPAARIPCRRYTRFQSAGPATSKALSNQSMRLNCPLYAA